MYTESSSLELFCATRIARMNSDIFSMAAFFLWLFLFGHAKRKSVWSCYKNSKLYSIIKYAKHNLRRQTQIQNLTSHRSSSSFVIKIEFCAVIMYFALFPGYFGILSGLGKITVKNPSLELQKQRKICPSRRGHRVVRVADVSR
jgi:hypothetical protein